MHLKLVLPEEKYFPSYIDACRELKENKIKLYSIHDPDEFISIQESFLQTLEAERKGKNLPPHIVPSTTFWLVDDGEFIAVGNIRHRLNQRLERFGGHIGYAVRYSKWNMGYGTLILSLLLPEAKKLTINTVLLTCAEDNIASARVIEKNGGVYQDTIINIVEGTMRPTKRYMININS